jgi:dynein heavy chain, axonemal
MKVASLISDDDWNYFLRGAAGISVDMPPKPDLPWLQLWQWKEACNLNSALPAFRGIMKDVTATPVWVQFGSQTVRKVAISIFS